MPCQHGPVTVLVRLSRLKRHSALPRTIHTVCMGNGSHTRALLIKITVGVVVHLPAHDRACHQRRPHWRRWCDEERPHEVECAASLPLLPRAPPVSLPTPLLFPLLTIPLPWLVVVARGTGTRGWPPWQHSDVRSNTEPSKVCLVGPQFSAIVLQG
jgi:hypothetical protein